MLASFTRVSAPTENRLRSSDLVALKSFSQTQKQAGSAAGPIIYHLWCEPANGRCPEPWQLEIDALNDPGPKAQAHCLELSSQEYFSNLYKDQLVPNGSTVEKQRESGKESCQLLIPCIGMKPELHRLTLALHCLITCDRHCWVFQVKSNKVYSCQQIPKAGLFHTEKTNLLHSETPQLTRIFRSLLVFVEPFGDALPETDTYDSTSISGGGGSDLHGPLTSKQHQYPNPWQQHLELPNGPLNQELSSPTTA